jgi:hypothetical protein
MSIPSFTYASTDESLVTGGLESFSPQVTPIVSSGLETDASPAPPEPSVSEQVDAAPAQIDYVDLQTANMDSILDSNGALVPIRAAYNPLSSALAQVSPSGDRPSIQNGLDPGGLYSETSYTGSNLKVLLEVANSSNTSVRLSKQLVELTTITVSVHRVKSPAVAMGYINAKGWARGRRTIAGTIVLTKFTTDVLYSFLRSEAFTNDLSKDSAYVKVDQLPPFNLTLLFGDEFGNASYQRLMGIEFVTSGDVYSIQEMYSEQTISYVAADFTPLLPLTQNSLYNATQGNTVTAAQRTVGDVLRQSQSSSIS